MKLIHTGDIHIGSAMKNLPLAKAQIRKREIIDAFRSLSAYAKEQGVDAVLIAGDLFDENNVERQIVREIFSIISSAEPVCFFYVSGNHDDEFSQNEALPKNLYLFSQTHGWQGYRLRDNVVITGADTRNFSAQLFENLRLNPSDFNVVLLHGDIQKNDTKESIPLVRMQGKGVDYFALGHIHKPMIQAERLDGRARFRYCGALEGRGFDECGEHGFFLLEIEKGRLRSEQFLSTAKRSIWEVKVDISACQSYFEMENAVFSALRDKNGEHLIKLILTGRHRADLNKNISLLNERINERFFFARIEDQSKIFIDQASFANDLSERGEFVREVGRYEMNEDLRAEVLEVGLKAISGEEIDL